MNEPAINTKSAIIIPSALVRVILFLVFIFLILPAACDKISNFITPDIRYTKSYELFVEDLNEGIGKKSYPVLMKKKSAIIGFSKDSKCL